MKILSILTFLLMLLVGAVIIYGVKLAIDGKWKDLLIVFIVLVVALWILGALGLSLPNIPSVR